MTKGLMKYEESNELYTKIVSLITSRKTAISQALNSAMIFLYWEIGEAICLDVLDHTKADYGNHQLQVCLNLILFYISPSFFG